MLDSKFKKQIGFIKTHSSKKNLREQPRFDSSDSFSSFDYDPKARNEQFSPYRHPAQPKGTVPNNKSASQPKQSQIPKQRAVVEHPKFSNLILRNNFIEQAKNKQREINKQLQTKMINQELQDINKQIKEVRKKFEKSQEEYARASSEEDTPKLPGNAQVPREEEELSLSNINRFRKSEEQYMSNPLPEQSAQNCPKTLAQYQRYLQQQSSSEQAQQQLRNKKTMKHKSHAVRRDPEEELITEWDKRQFKDKSMKAKILQHHNLNGQPQSKKGVYETRGGVCFEVDTRQFKGQRERPCPEARRKKKPQRQINTRQQLLIRRQTAKRFDRQSRVRLFGYA